MAITVHSLLDFVNNSWEVISAGFVASETCNADVGKPDVEF